jgi:hypothetical protein
LEDIQPNKARAPAPPKPPSIQKSVEELTQDFKDLLSEKVGVPINMITPVCSISWVVNKDLLVCASLLTHSVHLLKVLGRLQCAFPCLLR